MLEISKFYANPIRYKFPSVYKHAIQAAILADFLCYLSYIRAFEQELDVPYNFLILVNGYSNIRKIIRDAYRVHEHKQPTASDKNCNTCHKTICNLRLYLHSKFILLDVVPKLSTVINIAILVTAPFVLKTQCLMLLS